MYEKEYERVPSSDLVAGDIFFIRNIPYMLLCSQTGKCFNFHKGLVALDWGNLYEWIPIYSLYNHVQVDSVRSNVPRHPLYRGRWLFNSDYMVAYFQKKVDLLGFEDKWERVCNRHYPDLTSSPSARVGFMVVEGTTYLVMDKKAGIVWNVTSDVMVPGEEAARLLKGLV